jgi:hypothetical protein
MPQKDHLHELAKLALIAAGWVITDDPLRLGFEGLDHTLTLAPNNSLKPKKKAARLPLR